MRHVIVSRVSISMCMLFGACVLVFAWLVSTPAPAGPAAPAAAEGGEGEALFSTYCGRCHSVEELAGTLREAPDRDALLAEWEVFLETHGRTSAVQDRAILKYLAPVKGS